MDAISTDAADLHYSEPPPILLLASSDQALALAERSVIAAGFRVGARLPIEAAAVRIEQQISVAGVWVELDSDCGQPLSDLLSRIRSHVAEGRYSAVFSATSDLLDPLAALLDAPDIQILIDPDEADRAAALAIASARRAIPLVVSDIASDNNAERLRQLSEEVSRIASTLARLSTGPGAPVRSLEPLSAGDVPPLSADTVRSVIRARRLRSRYFRNELFADPAWDMLLDLLQA